MSRSPRNQRDTRRCLDPTLPEGAVPSETGLLGPLEVKAITEALGIRPTKVLGQNVVIVNRDGGSGVVGMRYVATQPADGHTLGLTPMTAIVVQPHLVRNTGTSPDNFAPVCGTNENVLGVIVRADSPIRNLQDLVAEGKRRPMSFGSPGPNSLPQLAVFRVQRATGVEFNHIPFRGDPPHLNEVLAGRLDFSAAVVASAAGLLDSGKLRLIAVFSDKRHPDFPEVPTAREQGVDALQYSPVGIYAPAGTPEPILAKLEEACRTGVQDENFLRVAKQARVVVDYKSRTDFTRLIRGEYDAYGPMMKALGVTPD